ncbi:MAG: hypothetical protein IPK83_20020 [Planctomycetes bacterium]|nr:hypothetical protein [Planctomycetota bacterium]
MRLTRAIAVMTVLSLVSASAGVLRAEGLSYGIRLKGYVNESGKIIKSVTLVVQDGKITKIGKRSRPPAGRAVTLDRSVLRGSGVDRYKLFNRRDAPDRRGRPRYGARGQHCGLVQQPA